MEEEFPRNENSVDFGKANNDKDNIYRVNIILLSLLQYCFCILQTLFCRSKACYNRYAA